MPMKRPTGLIVLCILSWVAMTFSLYSLVSEMLAGPLTDEQIREQEIVLIESQTPETMESMSWVIEESVAILNITKEQFSVLNLTSLIQLIIGIVGVFLMFQLRKIGFHLYIVYSLLGVLYWTYFFGSYSIGVGLAVGSALMGALFVLLYGLQLKNMK